MDTYEKKYKNALTIAQSRFKIEKDESVLTCLGMMFPELRESEDERIRKWLVDYFGSIKEVVWVHRDITCEQILDWLEKQKESNIPWYDYQKSKEAGYTIVLNEEYEQLIKQKEQKPDWSEEDEKMRYFVTEAVQCRYSDRELAKYLDPKIINEKKQLKKKLFDWLRDLRPSWKPSEELLDSLRDTIVQTKGYSYSMYLPELYEQLKKL